MKKNILSKTILFISYLLIMNSCEIDPWDFKLKITNSSDKAVYFYNSFSFPDTAILFEANPIKSPEFFKINPGDTESDRVRGTWEGKFESMDTLMIFIFDEETLQTVSWDTIRENYMILKRYDLSMEDLQEKDWTITYP